MTLAGLGALVDGLRAAARPEPVPYDRVALSAFLARLARGFLRESEAAPGSPMANADLGRILAVAVAGEGHPDPVPPEGGPDATFRTALDALLDGTWPTDRRGLARFASLLSDDLPADPGRWDSWSLDDYLERVSRLALDPHPSLAAHRGDATPCMAVADLLYIASIYE